jgi:hypothetical protein
VLRVDAIRRAAIFPLPAPIPPNADRLGPQFLKSFNFRREKSAMVNRLNRAYAAAGGGLERRALDVGLSRSAGWGREFGPPRGGSGERSLTGRLSLPTTGFLWTIAPFVSAFLSLKRIRSEKRGPGSAAAAARSSGYRPKDEAT